MLFNKCEMLLPKNADMAKWSVIACDQYTSEPGYWEKTAELVKGAPSAFNLILPEVYLGENDVKDRIEKINKTMEEYLSSGVFEKTQNGFVYVERTLENGSVRRGLVGCVDLEEYDYRPGSTSKIRATEKTVTERIPPRLKVREGASVELAHIMLLMDDEKERIIESLSKNKNRFKKLYDFDLMFSSGHIEGYMISGDDAAELEKKLADYENKRCADGSIVYAVGDGNHSLATAKEYYNGKKAELGEEAAKNSPSRYAMAELVNLHDDSLVFEAIHRVVFDVDKNKFISGLKDICGEKDGEQSFTLVSGEGDEKLCFASPSGSITVGTLQNYIDAFLEKNGGSVDYIHGESSVRELVKNGGVGMLLSPMDKHDLFKSVQLCGALPRKTFSMGEACDKRFYVEARVITNK